MIERFICINFGIFTLFCFLFIQFYYQQLLIFTDIMLMITDLYYLAQFDKLIYTS